MLDDVARLAHSIEAHLLFASIVWLAASLLISLPRGSATTKYWIWTATAVNFFLPLGAILDRLWAEWPPRDFTSACARAQYMAAKFLSNYTRAWCDG